jgi:hypothetical protein
MKPVRAAPSRAARWTPSSRSAWASNGGRWAWSWRRPLAFAANDGPRGLRSSALQPGGESAGRRPGGAAPARGGSTAAPAPRSRARREGSPRPSPAGGAGWPGRPRRCPRGCRSSNGSAARSWAAARSPAR